MLPNLQHCSCPGKGGTQTSTNAAKGSQILGGDRGCSTTNKEGKGRRTLHRAFNYQLSLRHLWFGCCSPKVSALDYVVPRLLAGERHIVSEVPNAAVFFSDIFEFTSASNTLGSEDLLMFMSYTYGLMDDVAARYGAYKVKTIGDAYLAVTGLPGPRDGFALSPDKSNLLDLSDLEQCYISCGSLSPSCPASSVPEFL